MKLRKKQCKKLLSILLAIVMVLGMFAVMPMSASAAIGDTFTEGAFTYTVTDEIYGKYSLILTGFDKSTTDVVIPAKVMYNGIEYSVAEIDKTAFSGNTEIVSVNIPGTVIKTNPSCFADCTALKTVTLNEGTEIIVAGTFKNTVIEEINLPKSIKSIYNMAFNRCSALKNIYFNSNIEFTSGRPFYKCTAIENVYCYAPDIIFDSGTLNNTNTTLKIHGYSGSTAEAYAQTKGFAFVPLEGEPPATEPVTPVEPDDSKFTWEKIKDGTAVKITGFKDEYKNDITADIPAEINGLPVTVIGESSFENSEVMYLTIPSSVIVIEDRAFYICSDLKTLTFSENSNLQKIGRDAFYRMQGANDLLNTVSLPSSLKLIDNGAFYNRVNLATAYVYSKDVYFGTEVFTLFDGTSNLKIYGYTGSTAETYAANNNHTFRYLDLDTTALQELYNQAAAIDPALYTEESYSVLNKAMIKADIMLHNSNATPADITECTQNLQAAIDGLVVYVPSTTNEPETTAAPTEYVDILLGDVDCNKQITITDVTLIQKFIAKLEVPDNKELYTSDTNLDGDITITDATIIQKSIAKLEDTDVQNVGTTVTVDILKPFYSDPIPTDPVDEPITFYVPNYVTWLTELGGKLWLYNDATAEFSVMNYDEENKVFWLDIPSSWSELSIYRTPYETTEADFDINSPWNEETQSGIILNKWEHLGSRGDYNCYKITGDGEGLYTMYDPNAEPDYMRTIYFDNSKTKWSTVYIYGWSFGLSNEWVMMEPVGNDIWSYTFYETLPVDGVKGFLFVNSTTWSGATQTEDLATEEGKNLFIPTPGGGKLKGTWDVYTPE